MALSAHRGTNAVGLTHRILPHLAALQDWLGISTVVELAGFRWGATIHELFQRLLLHTQTAQHTSVETVVHGGESTSSSGVEENTS